MPSEGGLFDGLYARGPAADAVRDRAWLQAMLDFEAALARARARLGELDAGTAEAIAAACAADRFDVAALGAEAARHATPVIGLVRALREAVGEPAAEHVHAGATSQDAIDTAAMLVARRAARGVLEDTAAAAAAAARQARDHAGTPMLGRTLLQPALPVSFGLLAASWCQGITAASGRLREVAERELAVQMGGPVGDADPRLAALVAEELGLAQPALPWHTVRVVPGLLAGALGVLTGVLAKAARDVILLSQGELGEVAEGGDPERGGSSAMAHKRNPVAAVSVLACTRRVPGLVATILSTMDQELQRAAGGWQAEWGTLTDLLSLSGSASAWGRDLLEGLEVHPDRMRANLGDRELDLGSAEELIHRAVTVS